LGDPSAPGKFDTRRAEFVDMGLGAVWLALIDTIGVDSFLAVWRILDAHPPHWHDSGRLRIEIRRYCAYLRFQRNRYVEALYQAGTPLPEIKRRVDLAFGENLTEAHLSRLCNRYKIREH